MSTDASDLDPFADPPTPTAVSSPKGSPSNPYLLGTRSSQLAILQTQLALSALSAAHPDLFFALRPMKTRGDKNLAMPLPLLAGTEGKSLWTEELEEALIKREVDMLVHSLKDVPTTLPDGCTIAAVLEREDPVDCVVLKKGLEGRFGGMEELEVGSVVGTSSVRRQASVRRAWPGLKVQDVRGNLNTRLAKLDDPSSPYTCLILARAGLLRLGLAHRIAFDLSPPTMLYAVGQGALGIETLSAPSHLLDILAPLSHPATLLTTSAERALLRHLGGGCSLPVGCTSSFSPSSSLLTLRASVTSPDGHTHIDAEVKKVVGSVLEAEAVGREVGEKLVKDGAAVVLEEVERERTRRVGEVEKAKQAAETVTPSVAVS